MEPQQPRKPEEQQTISKSQLKKMKKRQLWEETRNQRKEAQKQKKKLKKQEQQNKEQKALVAPEELPKRRRKDQYFEKLEKGLRVVIDMQFFDKMTEKEQHSLYKQLTFCHSTNRRHERVCAIHLTSTNPICRDTLQKKYNADHWGIKIHSEEMMETFKLQQLVYLTGDAEAQIDTFDDNSVYVIGGIVDHNRLKKITYDYAMNRGIRTARFPLGKFVELKTNCHLAVNHVFDMLLKVYNGKSWQETIKETIPNRKVIQKHDTQ